MAPPPKMRVNSYLYLLCRNLIMAEIRDLGQESGKAEIFDFFFKRIKSNYNAKDDKDTKGKVDYAKDYTTSFLRTVWNSHADKDDPDYKDYIFMPQKLDELVRYISLVGSFDTWSAFEKKYACEEGAVEAQQYMNMPFFKIPYAIRKRIEQWAYDRSNEIIFFIDDSKGVRNAITDSNQTFLIRTAREEDIKLSVEAAFDAYPPGTLTDVTKLKEWYTKNENVLYVRPNTKNKIDCFVRLLPITMECYSLLSMGKKYEWQISADDIHSIREREICKVIYIESLVCNDKLKLYPFFLNFEKMIEGISNLDANPRICAIGGTLDGIILLRNFNFTQVRLIDNDPVYESKYHFWETTWEQLKQTIEDSSKKAKRLTRLDLLK